MNKYKKIDLLQKAFEKADPNADQRIIYARMYGVLSARITNEQIDELLSDWNIEIPEEENV